MANLCRRNNKTYLGIRVNCPIFWSDVTIFGIYRQAVLKVTDSIIHGIASSKTRAGTTGQTDMTQLRGAFHGYANAPKMISAQVKGKGKMFTLEQTTKTQRGVEV
jgi:hypothetical protein